MAVYTGKDGLLQVRAPSGDLTAPTTPATATGATIGEVMNWRLTINQELLDQTEFGDEFRNDAGGLKNWNAQIDVNLDPSATVNQDEILEGMLAADFGGTLASSGVIQMDLYVDGEAATTKKVWYGAARVESVNVSTPVAGLVTASFNLRGQGVIKYSGAIT